MEDKNSNRYYKKTAFSLVEMLMALLVASLLMVALAPVITKRMNENLHITGDFVHNGSSEIVDIEFGGKYCSRITTGDNGNPLYCEGEYTVKEGYTNLTVTAIGAGGGGGTAPTAGFIEYIQEGSNNAFVVPNMVNELEATLISGGAGGGAGGHVETNIDFKTAGETNWEIPESIKNNTSNRNIIIAACGGGGGGGGTPGWGRPAQGKPQEYMSALGSGSGGRGGYTTKAVTVTSTTSIPIIIGGGGGGGARGTSVAAATGNSGTYGAGGGGGADQWGAGAGYGGSGGSAGGAGGISKGSATNFGGGGGAGDVSSSENGETGVLNKNSEGGNGASKGGQSLWYNFMGANGSISTPSGQGGGGGGGSVTGYGGGGGGGGSAGGGGGGGGGATIFGTRNNPIVIAPGGGGGGGATPDDWNYTNPNSRDACGLNEAKYWVILSNIVEQCGVWYGSAGGGGGGGGIGGGNGGNGGRARWAHGTPGANGADTYNAGGITFSANNCEGGSGSPAGINITATQGGDGKPGAMKITYLNYGPGGSGGGSGQYVPLQPVSVTPNDTLNVKIGAGASGGKAGKIETDGTITPAEWGNGGGGKGSLDTFRPNILTYISKGNGVNIKYLLMSNSKAYIDSNLLDGSSGPAGGSPKGQAFLCDVYSYCGCGGYLSDGKNYVWGNTDFNSFASKYNNQFLSNHGNTAGNGTLPSASTSVTYANGSIGGNGGETISPWFACTPGIGGTKENPKGGNASGYGGCGGGGGYGLADGGKGSGGYARISWNMYWNFLTSKYEFHTLGAGGGGAKGNVIKETLRVSEGQVIKIRIGAGGIGAKVANGELIPATSGGTTIFGDSNFIEIKAGGGGGGGNPYVKDGKLMKGEGGKPSNICQVGSRNYINNKTYCTKGEGGETPKDDGTNTPIGGLGEAFSYTVKGKTYLGQGGAGGMQSTENDNSKGGNAEGIGAGGGGAALLKYEYLQNTTQLNHPRGGNGANGRIIIELWG